MALSFERRGEPRRPAAELCSVRLTRLRPGPPVRVIDWSPRGVLIEAPSRLTPGARVSLQIVRRHDTLLVSGRVVRAYVAGITRHGGITYRGAVQLDQALDGG